MFKKSFSFLNKIFQFSFRNTLRAILVTVILTGFFCSAIYVFAVPPDTTYAPNATLNPSCSPGDTNCTVTAPAVYAFRYLELRNVI